MSKIKGAIVVDTERCKGCALCVEACPQDVIALALKKVNVHGYRYVEAVNADACVGVYLVRHRLPRRLHHCLS